MRVRSVVPLALAGLLTLVAAAVAPAQMSNAQTSTAPPKPAATPKPSASAKPDAQKPDPAKDAFLGLGEDDRKAAQEALVWLGLYNGVSDGAWGKRSGDAIAAFQKKTGKKADGVLTPEELGALAADGAKLRETLGFALSSDAATGIVIGAPMRILQKLPGEAGHSAFASKDGSAKLDLYAVAAPPSEEPAQNLEAMFKALSADSDTRKVAYKAMKAGAFFVVSGSEDDTKFYARYALGPKGVVRGFEFRYPLARAEAYDRVAIAISNSFDPNPQSKSATPAPTPVASAPPSPAAPSGPQIIATALVLAPGQALTALTPAECGKPLVSGAPATFGRVDDASGLARLDGDFGAGASPAVASSSDTAEVFVLSRAPGAGEKSVVEAGRGEWARTGADGGSVLAPAATSARGAPVFNLRGEVIGVIAPSKTPPHRFAGVIVAEPHRVLAGAPLEAFVAKGAAEAGPDLSAPELARRFAPRVLAVTCGA
jgi:peptidoglycan hydrolase-like protein with peptidoglycan-binding domain